MIFTFEKYELIYLSRKIKRFNMRMMMKINYIIIKLKINIKMLKLQINIKLKWHFHMKTIKIKMITQCMTLTLFKILTFTWKTFFVKIKQIYSMMIHSIMIYTSTIWHEFINKLNENLNDRFFVIQNKCVRMITNIFKIISIQILKIKTIVLLFNVHLNKLQMKIRMWLKNSNYSQQIKIVCDRMTRRLRGVKKWPICQNPISNQKKMI